LMMDNASIHKGVEVSQALKKVSPRLGVAYQPPYMPTVNPVELVNSQLKAKLKRLSKSKRLRELEEEIEREKKKQAALMDPQGGVVFDAPINDDADDEEEVVDADNLSLSEFIELVLDRFVTRQNVVDYVAHCGWRD
jgi:DDE superfamily endonuclease